jgi:hypothetical protein
MAFTNKTLDIESVAAVAEFFERRSERNSSRWLIPGKRETPYAEGVANDARYEPVTVFHSKNVPEVSLLELAKIFQRNCKCSVDALVIAFVLMARYELVSGQAITAHTMHRLFVGAYQVGLKLHSDFFYSNKYIASVMGIQTWEMNRLEEGLLHAIDWYASVSPAAFTAALTNPTRLFEAALHSPFATSSAAATNESFSFVDGVRALFERSSSSADEEHVPGDECSCTVTPQLGGASL